MAKKKICVALQGGGAHGAFTWGVLDRLLEEDSLEIQAVSGTSAGAMNGAVMVDALKRGGRQHARERLERFWRSISDAGDNIFKPGRMLFPAFGPNSDWSPMAIWTDALSLVWSPYDNPFYANVLADVIGKELPDFNALNDDSTPHLFVCATNVKTNQRKIFRPGELSVGALTASACLPTIFQSVEVNGEFYWDGGYLGNPALYPLRNPSLTPDLLIVWVNPLNRHDVPTNARDILDRMNEVTFNATLVQEIEAIDAVNELKPRGNALRSPYKRIRLHEIKDEPALAKLGHASKSDTDWDFLLMLRDFGRQAAKRWLRTDFDNVGRKQTADMNRVLRCLESR
ncbi:MAG TPA: patatin-like phospholipase family protein [Casimicrobiaceae bacterium]|nr:patatin-like phospholipase family protein [Casimicrobiaceae bacterium]